MEIIFGFLVASSIETKKVIITNKINNKIITSKPTITACKKELEKLSFAIEDCLIENQSIVHKNWKVIATRIIESKLKTWKAKTGATKCLILFNTGHNFREDLPLLYTPYKCNRDPDKKPLMLKEVRKLLQENYPCDYIHDAEADDLIAMYQYKGDKEKGKYIVVTPDKDANQTPGFVYNPMGDTITYCSGFGTVPLISKLSKSGNKTYKVQPIGRCSFYWQMVCGDKVDTYSPFKPTKTAYRFYTEFKDIKTDKEAWQYVYNSYKNYFGEITEWTSYNGIKVKGTLIDLIQVYMDVVHMQRFEGDRPLVRDILHKMKIKL